MSSSHEKTFAMLTAALGDAVGVPGVTPGSDGVFRMEVGARLLSVIPQGDAVVLYSSLGTLPEDGEKADAVRVALLSANVLYRGSFGACLGVASEDNVISLCFQTPMHSLTEQSFVSLVENFLTLADLWDKRLAELTSGAPTAGPAGAGGGTVPPLMNDPLMRA